MTDCKKPIKLHVKSQVCNLVFDEMERRKNESKLLAAKRRAAYEKWIDSIPQRYEFETTDRSLASVETVDSIVTSLSEEAKSKARAFAKKADKQKPDLFSDLLHQNQIANFCEPDDLIEFTTDGNLVYRAGRLSVIYDESVILEKNCKTTLTFREEKPYRISIFRSGEDNASLVFDSVDRRIMCMYNTFAGQIAMTIITHNIVNTITDLVENGSAILVMDYTIEVNGVKTEYTHYEMSIELDDSAKETESDVPLTKL